MCLFCPNKGVADILYTFFRLLSEWKWPLPVVLTKIQETPDNWDKNIPVWNPRKNAREAGHVMPIITPAFPAMNTTHSMHHNHKKIITQEFQRGFEILRTIERELPNKV